MILGRLSSRREFTPVPSYGSVFVYTIPTQNVIPVRVIPARVIPARVIPARVIPARVIPARVTPARVIPARVHPGSCAGVRFSSWDENLFRCHVNRVRLFISYPLKFHQFYDTIRRTPQQTRLYVNMVQLFISPRNERRAVIM